MKGVGWPKSVIKVCKLLIIFNSMYLVSNLLCMFEWSAGIAKSNYYNLLPICLVNEDMGLCIQVPSTTGLIILCSKLYFNQFIHFDLASPIQNIFWSFNVPNYISLNPKYQKYIFLWFNVPTCISSSSTHFSCLKFEFNITHKKSLMTKHKHLKFDVWMFLYPVV